ncbi:MAG: ParB N-terminal domain-containing protein [Candidatus Methanomethylicaceae archaeon]|nr:ParB N-terminal domain-containing protein [Candidatus Verstraetearchaeota archaeon]
MSNQIPRVVILPIDDIRPHEEYDRWILLRIVGSLRLEGAVHDPILVDERTLTILDGTHRYWALKKLGCSSVPAALYNYQSQSIKVGCWYRCLNKTPPLDLFRLMKPRATSNEEALKLLNGRKACLSILMKGESYVFDWDPVMNIDVYDAYQFMAFLEGGFKSRGYGVTYAAEMDAMEMLSSGETCAVMAPPSIKKEEVILTIKYNKLFPKKSTRHVLPYRPMGLNIPISWLKGNSEEASQKLQDLLSRGTFQRMRGGVVIGGRRYEEEVYIFELRTSGGGFSDTSGQA